MGGEGESKGYKCNSSIWALDPISLSQLRDYDIVIIPSLTCIIMLPHLYSLIHISIQIVVIIFHNIPLYVQLTTLQMSSSFRKTL